MALLEQSTVRIGRTVLETFVGGVGQPPICTAHPTNWHTTQSVQNDVAVQAFAAASRVVSVNPRGTGNSSPIRHSGDLTFGQLVEDIEALRRQLHVERWVFAGGSGGGILGLLYALAYPEALAGLIIWISAASGVRLIEDADSRLSPKHPAWAADLAAARPQIAQHTPGQAARWWETVRDDLRIYCEGPRPLVMLEGADFPERLRIALEEITSFDMVDRLGEIKVPTLVVAGRRDEMIPLRQSEPLARIPGAEFVVFDESGHGFTDADGVRFGAAVQRFMGERVRR